MNLTRKQTLLGLLGLILVLAFIGYLRSRSQLIVDVQKETEAVATVRKEIATALPELEVEEAITPPPDPKPDVTGWLNNNVLSTLPQRLVVNNQRSSDGKGATLHLVTMPPPELAHLFNQMTAVSLQIKQFRIEDLSASGKWDITVILEAPDRSKVNP